MNEIVIDSDSKQKVLGSAEVFNLPMGSYEFGTEQNELTVNNIKAVNSTVSESNHGVSKTQIMLWEREYKRLYILHYIYTMFDFRIPSPREEWVKSKISERLENIEKTKKKPSANQENAKKKPRANHRLYMRIFTMRKVRAIKLRKSILKLKADTKLKMFMRFFRMRKIRAKTQKESTLKLNSEIVRYFECNREWLKEPIQITYKKDEAGNKTRKIQNKLSDNKVAIILKATKQSEPKSRDEMSYLLWLVKKEQKRKRIIKAIKWLFNNPF